MTTTLQPLQPPQPPQPLQALRVTSPNKMPPVITPWSKKHCIQCDEWHREPAPDSITVNFDDNKYVVCNEECKNAFNERHTTCCHCACPLGREFCQTIAWGHSIIHGYDFFYLFCSPECKKDCIKVSELNFPFPKGSFTLRTDTSDDSHKPQYKVICPFLVMYNGNVGVVAESKYESDATKVALIMIDGGHIYSPQEPKLFF